MLRLAYVQVYFEQICQGLLLRGHLPYLTLLLRVRPQRPLGDLLVRLLADVADTLD